MLFVSAMRGAVCLRQQFVQLFHFFIVYAFLTIMTARQTNNSLAAALSFNEVSSTPVSSMTSGGTSSVVPSHPGEPVVVSSPLVSAAASANPLLTASTAVLSPDLVSLINQAVQVAVQASQRPPDPAIVGPASCSGASSSSASLGGLASTFLATGTGFQPSNSSSSTSGRPIPLIVLPFVSTFTAPVPFSSSGHALSSISAQLPPSIVNLLADQPFVVGPSFSPIPAKLVSQIRS